MSNIILSSNENSALLQTLNQSESKVINAIYSTRTINAPSATNWYSGITPKTGSATSGQSQSFDLPKYGILEQIVFNYTKTVTFTRGSGTATVQIVPGDFFNVISRFEFLSSSRVLFTLYAEDIVAQLKNLSTDEYSTIANFLTGTSASAAGATEISKTYSFPIVFSMFNQHNTAPNLMFNEPCQLRVVYNDINVGLKDASSPADPPSDVKSAISDVSIMLRYKMYSESDNAQLLASNYEEEQLNQLTSRAYRENPVSFENTGGAAVSHDFVMELRNVDVAEDFYFIARQTPSTLGTDNELLPISRVRLTASGQELCDLSTNQLLYMKLSDSGYPVNSSYIASGMQDPMKINNVAKIQTGIWSYDKSVWSNGVSMRELNNVVATITVSVPAGKTVTVYCQEVTSCILSCSSNTGRTAISLAN